MDFSKEQLIQGLNKAAAEGNMEVANELGRALLAMDPNVMEGHAPSYIDEARSVLPESVNKGIDWVAENTPAGIAYNKAFQYVGKPAIEGATQAVEAFEEQTNRAAQFLEEKLPMGYLQRSDATISPYGRNMGIGWTSEAPQERIFDLDRNKVEAISRETGLLPEMVESVAQAATAYGLGRGVMGKRVWSKPGTEITKPEKAVAEYLGLTAGGALGYNPEDEGLVDLIAQKGFDIDTTELRKNPLYGTLLNMAEMVGPDMLLDGAGFALGAGARAGAKQIQKRTPEELQGFLPWVKETFDKNRLQHYLSQHQAIKRRIADENEPTFTEEVARDLNLSAFGDDPTKMSNLTYGDIDDIIKQFQLVDMMNKKGYRGGYGTVIKLMKESDRPNGEVLLEEFGLKPSKYENLYSWADRRFGRTFLESLGLTHRNLDHRRLMSIRKHSSDIISEIKKMDLSDQNVSNHFFNISRAASDISNGSYAEGFNALRGTRKNVIDAMNVPGLKNKSDYESLLKNIDSILSIEDLTKIKPSQSTSNTFTIDPALSRLGTLGGISMIADPMWGIGGYLSSKMINKFITHKIARDTAGIVDNLNGEVGDTFRDFGESFAEKNRDLVGSMFREWEESQIPHSYSNPAEEFEIKMDIQRDVTKQARKQYEDAIKGGADSETLETAYRYRRAQEDKLKDMESQAKRRAFEEHIQQANQRSAEAFNEFGSRKGAYDYDQMIRDSEAEIRRSYGYENYVPEDTRSMIQMEIDRQNVVLSQAKDAYNSAVRNPRGFSDLDIRNMFRNVQEQQAKLDTITNSLKQYDDDVALKARNQEIAKTFSDRNAASAERFQNEAQYRYDKMWRDHHRDTEIAMTKEDEMFDRMDKERKINENFLRQYTSNNNFGEMPTSDEIKENINFRFLNSDTSIKSPSVNDDFLDYYGTRDKLDYEVEIEDLEARIEDAEASYKSMLGERGVGTPLKAKKAQKQHILDLKRKVEELKMESEMRNNPNPERFLESFEVKHGVRDTVDTEGVKTLDNDLSDFTTDELRLHINNAEKFIDSATKEFESLSKKKTDEKFVEMYEKLISQSRDALEAHKRELTERGDKSLTVNRKLKEMPEMDNGDVFFKDKVDNNIQRLADSPEFVEPGWLKDKQSLIAEKSKYIGTAWYQKTPIGYVPISVPSSNRRLKRERRRQQRRSKK